MVYEVYENQTWDGMTGGWSLTHHGIMGQKWGVRRFQNPDGTLTAAGRERYGRPTKNGGTTEYKNSGTRKMLNDPFRMSKLGEHRATRLANKAAKRAQEGDEKGQAKAQRKADAQAAANDNRKAWDNRQTTSRLATSQGARGLSNLIGSFQSVPVNPQAFVEALSQVMSGSVSTAALQELANITAVFNPAQLVLNTVANNAVVTPNYRHARARGSGVVRSILESGAGVEPIGSILRYVGDKDAYGALTWFS